jgi:hypothetical protein
MSMGSAQKRAAKSQERLMNQQEELLAKEEAKKKEQSRDVEKQRINTLRQRFGGTAVDDSEGTDNTSGFMKNKTPMSLSKRPSMLDTVMQQGAQ